MIPSESEVMYRGTAAGTREPHPPHLKCIRCKSIIGKADRGVCPDCRIDARLQRTPSSTLCRSARHDLCNGHWAVEYACGCHCHDEAA